MDNTKRFHGEHNVYTTRNCLERIFCYRFSPTRSQPRVCLVAVTRKRMHTILYLLYVYFVEYNVPQQRVVLPAVRRNLKTYRRRWSVGSARGLAPI